MCKKKGRRGRGVGGMTHIRCVGKEGIETDVLEKELRQVYWEGRRSDRCIGKGGVKTDVPSLEL